MSTHIAFLRGVNVGGNRIIKSAEFKSAFEKMKFTNVRVVLASGNVVFDSPETDEKALTAKIEQGLSKQFSYPAKLILASLPVLRKIVDAYPFDVSVAENHHYILFATPSGTKEIFSAVQEAGVANDVRPGKSVLYWTVTKGSTLDNPVSKIFSKAKFKDFSTMRNINTLQKILSLE